MSFSEVHRRLTALWKSIENALMSHGGARPGWRSFAGTLLVVALLSVVLILLRSSLGAVSAAMVFLLCCLLIALRLGRGPAVLAAITTSSVLDFNFLPPIESFTIGRSDHVLSLFVFLIVALVTSSLAASAQARTRIAEQHEARTALLYRLNEGLVRGRSLAEILETIVRHVVNVYGATEARILARENDDALEVLASFPSGPERPLTRNEQTMALMAMSTGTAAGLGTTRARVIGPHGVGVRPPTGSRGNQDVLYMPINTPSHHFGVLEVRGRPNGGRFDDADRDLLSSLADQAALALDRVRLSDEAARLEVLERTNALQSALLAAVSHDLRTPLAAIKTSVTSLLDTAVPWDEESREAFLEAIDEETDRLTRMVRNLLDLSRIEAGALRPDKDWNDAGELLHQVARRFRGRAEATGHTITVLEGNSDDAYFDYVEIDQVLSNLVENAIKYTPPATTIMLGAAMKSGRIEFTVADDGPGISPGDRDRLFNRFFRSSSNARIQGTGIGLAIAKGLVEAHNGRIWLDTAASGARFVIEIPMPDRADEATSQVT